jgi:spermidine/putrescine transport system permease protein
VTALAAGLAHGTSEPPPDEARRPGRRRSTPYLLLLPGALWLGVFFVAPMVFLASQSLQTGSLVEGYSLTWRFQTYLDVLGNYHVQLLRSLTYAASATVLALLIAYPLAYTIAFRAGRWKNVLLVLVVAPFFTSFLIRTLAWQNILATDGPVTGLLRSLGVTYVLQALGLIANDKLLGTPWR